MTATRRLLTVSAAAGALVFAAPALAETNPGPGPEMTYEYAVPAQGGVTYSGQPVVQPLPAPQAMEWHGDAGGSYEVETMGAPPYPGGPMPAPMAHPGHMAQRSYAPPMPPRFDRGVWLDDCRARIRGVRHSDQRASIITGLLGAVAGGVIGNKVYDSNRTAGALIGAGVGGLAGLAIGAAIDAAGKRRDDCTVYLDRYMSGGYGSYGYGYGQPGYAYGYGHPGYGYGYGYNYGYSYGYGAFTYMPVLVAVPQKRVVREYVTEEYVDVPVRTRTIYKTRTKVIRQPAPAPVHDKRIKYAK